MKTIVTQVLILSNLCLGLTACGTDNQAAPAALETSKATTTETYSQSVSLFSDMPECDKAREGQLVMVEEEGILYVCKKKEWIKAELSGEAVDIEAVKGDKGDKGDQGEAGTAGAIGSIGSVGSAGQDGQDGEDNDALFLEVNDATLTAIADQAAGKKISVLFNGVTLITHSAALQLKGQGNFTTAAGDLFELVSLGNSKWKELSRSVSAESYVRARMYNLTFPLSSGWTKMPYNYEIADTQGEFNSSTGDFTAKQKGVYAVTGNFTSAVSSWTAGGSCGAGIYVNGGLTSLQTSVMPTATVGCTASTAKTVELNVGDVVNIYIYMNRSGLDTNIDWSAEYNSITVTKVR